MTEKRFTIIYNEDSKMIQYVDNQKEEPNRWAICNVRETAQKLNQLNDENEQLQKDCTALIYSNQDYRKENKQLKEDVKYFNETYSAQEYGLDIETHVQLSSPIPSRKELLKENEQLQLRLKFCLNKLKVYRKIASCGNCQYHDYDWDIDDGYGGEEYEVCEKGNDVTDGICEDWEELD